MAPPPLPPLSCVAGSLALSFTGAQPIAEPVTPDAIVPELPEPPPAPDIAAPTAAPTAAAPSPAQPERPINPPAPVITTWPKAMPVAPPRTHLLRPTEKRFFFQLFVGGAKTLLGGYSSYGGGGMDFKLEGAIGGHGKKRKSLAGAAVVQYRTGAPFSSFTLAPRLQWDKQIVPDHAIYLTTTATLGYRLTSYSGYGLGALLYGYHGGVASVGWGISAIVAERVLLTFRPVNPEIEANGLAGFAINWDVFGGLGVVW